MSERLYYDDCYLREFEAVVVDADDGGRRVILDRTAFYPTSGGQPFDLGTLNDAAVIEVIDADRGVVHVLDRPAGAGRVRGKIDWNRRFDHMQQHTGQHLLSAAFEELYGMKTVSFHLGSEVSTIDLAAPAISPKQIVAVERRVNALVFENRPVRIAYEDADAAEGLRKQSDRKGLLRIVSIEGLDRSACGGTHVRTTGEIGPILLRKTEKIRSNIRVEFLCGLRAVLRARKDYDALADIAQVFSSGIDESAALVRAQSARLADAEKVRKKLSGELAQARGRALHGETPPSPDGIRRHFAAHSAGPLSDETRYEAQSFVAGGKAIFLAVTSEPASVLVAASPDSGADAGQVIKEFVQAEGGRGGGNAQIAQGSIPAGTGFNRLRARLGFDG